MFYNLLLLSCLYLANSKDVIETVSSININNYLGNWKQLYQAPTNIIFQGYGTY